ncbi:Rho Ras-like GTP-binding protein [Vairimorpha necatrix]|uniref:Rho Ras-like GTP-binding protein n=1 Tax=Vairimorpha necatrix TaxID=6039 RepID=A0AAX4JCK9_9MICR
MNEGKQVLSKQLTVLGYGTCGKTSILNRQINQKFDEKLEPTVFTSANIEYKEENHLVELKLWDTAGQDEFSRFRHLALPNAHYVLICFNVDNRKSYNEVTNTFIPQIKEINPEAKYFLAATKIDLRDDSETLEKLAHEGDSPITRNEGMRLAKEIDAVAYFETSAKLNIGISELFEQVAKYAIKENSKKDRSALHKLLCFFSCC